jgi:hypothetical protein
MDGVLAIVDTVIATVMAHKMVAAMLLFLLYQMWQQKKPLPDYPGAVVTVNDLSAWNALMQVSAFAMRSSPKYALARARVCLCV